LSDAHIASEPISRAQVIIITTAITTITNTTLTIT
jgi:hypothetical protein